jgi:Fanconi-associated nuclease 1
MNSSPPPPSFTLPPLNARGQFPITPSPTPSPNEELDNLFSPRKNKEAHDVEDVGRISMYVKLFDGESPLSLSDIKLMKRRDVTNCHRFRIVLVHSSGAMGLEPYLESAL